MADADVLRIVDTLGQAPPGTRSILAPTTARYAEAMGELAGLLPVSSNNEEFLEVARSITRAPEGSIAACFLNDPYTAWNDIANVLARSGIETVVNLPSLGAVDGILRESLAEGGFDYENEMRRLVEFRERGFRIFCLAHGSEQFARAAELEPDAILLGGTNDTPPSSPPGATIYRRTDPLQFRRLPEDAAAPSKT